MSDYTYITLRERQQLKDMVAQWFYSKWGVPKEAYLESMEAYLNKKTEYGWEFLCMVHGDDEPDVMTRMYIHQ